MSQETDSRRVLEVALDQGLAEELWRRSEAWVARDLSSADGRSAAVQVAATPE